jgi:hypothetical protein
LISISKGSSENYLAKIIIVPEPRIVKGLDNLVEIIVDRIPVLTSKNTKAGSIAIYFPSGSKLNPIYLAKNNEFRADLQLNEDRLNKGGFFEEKCRVKPVKFKGNMSDGYIAPIETLQPIIGDKYKKLEQHINEEFDSIGDFILLSKYISPNEQKSQGISAPKNRDKYYKKYESRIIDKQFKFHSSTAHLNKNLHRLEPEDLISITWKLHGTSFISSKVLCKRKPRLNERIYKWIRTFLNIGTTDFTEYANLYASRTVIKNANLNENKITGHYDEDIYKVVNDTIKDKLFTGESVYGEIVGFTSTGRAIQAKYDYGCLPGEHKAFVYRITYTGGDGNTIDLPYRLMQQRCKELSVEPVPLIYYGKANQAFTINDSDKEAWQNEFYNKLKVTYVKNQQSIFCKSKVIEEGIVVRVEGLSAFALKMINDGYKLHESKVKDEGLEDMEESQETDGN